MTCILDTAFFLGRHAPVRQGQLRLAARIDPPRHPEPNYGGWKEAVLNGRTAPGVIGPAENAPTAEYVHSQPHQELHDLLHRVMHLAVAPCLSPLLIAYSTGAQSRKLTPINGCADADLPNMRSGRGLVVPLLQRLQR